MKGKVSGCPAAPATRQTRFSKELMGRGARHVTSGQNVGRRGRSRLRSADVRNDEAWQEKLKDVLSRETSPKEGRTIVKGPDRGRK